MHPANEIEVRNIIMCLNPLKAVSLNSIPTKILNYKLMMFYLIDLTVQPFSQDVFPYILKTSNFPLVYEK